MRKITREVESSLVSVIIALRYTDSEIDGGYTTQSALCFVSLVTSPEEPHIVDVELYILYIENCTKIDWYEVRGEGKRLPHAVRSGGKQVQGRQDNHL